MSSAQMMDWHADANIALHGLGMLSQYWVKAAFAFVAILWMMYRGWLVLSKPVEELVSVLGVDLPVPPEVSLAGLKCDGVLLHWKPEDPKTSVVRYQLLVNGIRIRDLSQQETPITVTSLRPNHSYTIRIVAVNSNNFQAASAPIRITTHPASVGEYFDSSTPTQPSPSSTEPSDETAPLIPVVRQYKALLDGASQNTPPAILREHSNSQPHSRRSLGGRRSTPTSPGHDLVGIDGSQEDKGKTVLELTEKLEGLRKETEEVEKQIDDEEDSFKTQKLSHSTDRDTLKQSLKEKEDISRDLRKNVNIAERANAAAQARKTTLEKQLQQKQNQRTKMVDDVKRWESDIEDIDDQVQEMEGAKIRVSEETEAAIAELKAQHGKNQAANKNLEDEIGTKRAEIKDLEEERKELADETNGSAEPHPPEADIRAVDWPEKEMAYRIRSHQLTHELQQRQIAYAQLQAQLDFLHSQQQRRSSQSHILSGMSSPDQLLGRRNSIRRPGSALNEPTSISGGFVPPTSSVSFSNSVASGSPSFNAISPFFNYNNGMSVQRDQPHTSMPQSEIDMLTGGAPMSPTTGESLIPSGLFGDDVDALNGINKRNSGSIINQALGPQILPGLGAPQTLERDNQGPSSPVSIPSRSPSVFASPRDSSSHLAFIPGTENMDSDRRSIRSNTSSLRAPAIAAPSKFSSLFGFSRQRGKTLDEHGPALGSLKPSQSHSMPRQDQLEQDPIGTRRRRGSHSGNWIDSMSSAFSRSSAAKHPPVDENQPTVATRRRPFTMFGGTKSDNDWPLPLGLNRSSSPRPGSVTSLDYSGLPRPSVESQQRFGWPINRAGSLSPAGQARSALSPEQWSSLGAPPSSWSRVTSQPPSIKENGSATDLTYEPDSLGSDEDDTDDEPGTASPSQAPIGTRPARGALAAARLNPAAPNFKSLFSRNAKGDRSSEKSSRSRVKDHEKNKDRPPTTPSGENTEGQDTLPATDSSPSNRRKSRDGRSISTAADSTLSEPRSSLDRSSSRTPSETQLNSMLSGSSAGKESFMSKLSRKSSSGKFNLYFGKEKNSGNLSVSSKKGLSGTSDVGTVSEVSSTADDDVALADKSGANAPSKSSALSWTNIKRIGRRGDKTPSIHESLASESNASGDEKETEED